MSSILCFRSVSNFTFFWMSTTQTGFFWKMWPHSWWSSDPWALTTSWPFPVSSGRISPYPLLNTGRFPGRKSNEPGRLVVTTSLSPDFLILSCRLLAVLRLRFQISPFRAIVPCRPNYLSLSRIFRSFFLFSMLWKKRPFHKIPQLYNSLDFTE